MNELVSLADAPALRSSEPASLRPRSSRSLPGIRENIADVVERALRRRAPLKIGYIGGSPKAANLGDRAVFDAARRLFPHASLFTFRSPKREERLGRLRLSGRGYFNAVILGGGTFINPMAAAVVRYALDAGLPVSALGSGVGNPGHNFEGDVDLSEWTNLLPRFNAVTVRGPRSKANLARIGVNNVDVIGDLALELTWSARSVPAGKQYLLNAITPFEGFAAVGDHPGIRALTACVQQLSKDGWCPVPVAMDDSDAPPLRFILDEAGLRDVPIIRSRRVDDFFAAVAPCSFAIATRLHAAVLASCAGVPPLMMGYRDKCFDFMSSMGIDELCCDWDRIDLAGAMDLSERIVVGRETLQRQVYGQAVRYQKTIRDFVSRMSF